MRHFTDALFEEFTDSVEELQEIADKIKAEIDAHEEDYDPPYSAEEIKANYGEETYKKLVQDPAHRWRMDTGIELIHKEPSKKELDRIWANWQLMDAKSKSRSDEKSIELFGLTNAENYKKLCPLYESKPAEFFKDSILRKADGSLIPFYHGTNHNFTTFDPAKAGKGGPLGVGMYFTSNPARGSEFGNTKTVYLNVKNPKMFKTKSQPRDFLVAMSNEYKIEPQDVAKNKKSLNQKITELLQADGYDGVLCYFSNLDEMWCVVYNANQIKSVDNTNPTNSDDIFEKLEFDNSRLK